MLPLDQLTTIAQQHPHPLLFATISGAHLYGFPSSDSDYDLRGVHCLPLREIVGLTHGQDTVERSEWTAGLELDLVTHDVEKFFRLLLKRNGYVLEQLYSPLVVCSTPEHEELKAIAPHCITRHHSHHYLGFARTQWGLFAKAPVQKVKPLLYVYRVLLTGIHLMQTGAIEANLLTLNDKFQLPYLPDLIERKRQGIEQAVLNTVDLAFHEMEYQKLVQALEQASEQSALPDGPSAQAALHDVLLRVRLGALASA